MSIQEFSRAYIPIRKIVVA